MSREQFIALAFLNLISAPLHSQAPFPTSPSWISADVSNYSTGLGWVDLNRDGWIDLVVANGNDMERQRVAVYYNYEGTLPQTPDWQSGDIDYHGHLSIADVNGDGYPDVAVSVYLGPAAFYERGYVKLYLNNHGTLSSLPSWRSRDSMFTFSCAFGDANGDGRPDLAVACGESYTGRPEQPRIYFNRNGTLDSLPGWFASSAGYTIDAAWNDFDNDGILDLVFASANGQNVLYKGYGDSIGTAPLWTSADSPGFANSICAADIDGDSFADLAVSDNWQQGGNGHFKYYRNEGGALSVHPFWHSNFAGLGSGITLADVTGDGKPDLITGGWWNPLRIYINQGGTFLKDPQWVSLRTSVVEAISLADIENLALDTLVSTFIGDGKRKFFVLTQAPLQELISIRVENVELPASQYCYDRESGWVSVGVTPAVGDSVVVTAVLSHRLDIAVSNWDPNVGNFIFRNNGATSVARDEDYAPAKFALDQNYPNPFNPATTIAYSLPVRSVVTVSVYNILGERVAELVHGEQAAGLHKTGWQATMPSGVYLCRIDAVSTTNSAIRYTSTRKMILLR